MLENYTWQSIPGTSSCEIYPLERKPDIKSSNSYIIRSEAEFFIIDPGADKEQICQIADVMIHSSGAKKKPVFIILTHCHYDHLKGTQQLILLLGYPCAICIQEIGAEAIEAGDGKFTLSYLYNEKLPEHSVSIRLLEKNDWNLPTKRAVHFGKNAQIILYHEILESSEGKQFLSQSMSVGKSDTIFFYHTPGHSPDSICIRIGELLFSGDLLLASNPGIAGIPGWNKDQLINSLNNLEWLSNQANIQLCTLGHGRALPGNKLSIILQRTILYTQRLDNIVELDLDRVHFLDDYAKNLLDEISELFSVISGKLLSLSYHLESLSEEEEAQKILDKLDIDAIDGFLSEFNKYVNEYSAGDQQEMAIPLKAIQVIMKIKKIFNDDQLKSVINVSLLRRVRWLILDFLNIMQGFREEVLGKSENISLVLIEYLTELQKPVIQDQDFMASSGDENAFVQEMIRRIALRNIYENVEITFTSMIGVPNVYIEKERFCDMMTALFESIVTAGAKRIQVEVSQQNENILIELKSTPEMDFGHVLSRKVQFVERIFMMFGAKLLCKETDHNDRLIIELLPAADCFMVS